jgi:carbonic anhydrase
VHGWVYKFETGEVFAYDVDAHQFLPLSTEGSESAVTDD